MAPLLTYIQNSSVAATLTLNGAQYLPVDGTNNSNVLSGAYVPTQCNSGYVLMSGQLNITCVGNAWTTFPACAPNSGSGSLTANNMSPGSGSPTATNMSPGNGLPCTIDTTTTFNITNGYAASISLSYQSTTAATGN
jgi:hypothetical protein